MSMSISRLWLVTSTVASIGVGFLGGLMYSRRTEPTDAAIGRLYEIDEETYIDGALVEFLTARADRHETVPCSDLLPCPKKWTALHFRAVVLFVKLFVERSFLPHQRGALYMVRGEKADAVSDREVHRFLQEMIDLGLVQRVARWSSWRDVPSALTDPRPAERKP